MNKCFFIVLTSLILINALSVTHTLKWNGGHCSICTNNPHSNYACSNNHGNYNGGNKVFANVVPAGNVVTGVSAILHGLWSCDVSTSFINTTLQGNEIQTLPASGVRGCPCGTCDLPVTFTRTDPCFPNYNYNGNNIINLKVPPGKTICVEDVVITLTYQPGNPQTCGLFVPTCPGGCTNGVCIPNLNTMTASCRCPTGLFGPNCQCRVPSHHLITDNPPSLDVSRSGFNAKDVLYLYVNNSVKYFNTTITFKNDQNGLCAYPTAVGVAWSKVFNPATCQYVLEGIIPWGVAYPSCIFSRTEDSNWVIFTGEMIVENQEHVGNISDDRPIDVYRTIISRLPFQVRYPKSISVVSENIRVFAEVSVEASITRQAFVSGIPALPGSAQVVLLTTVQYPFRIINPSVLLGDLSRFTLSRVENTLAAQCPDTLGSICVQYWNFTILPNISQCNFDGDYDFNFTLGCTPSRATNCPLDNNTNKGMIEFTLDSEDFCVDIVEDIDLSGSIGVYKDAGHTIVKKDFLPGQTVFMSGKTSSNKATIIRTVVNDIDVTLWNGTTVNLYRFGLSSVMGNRLSLAVNNALAAESWLQFVVVDSVFAMPFDSFEVITFQIDFNVTYYNTQIKKRQVSNEQQRFIIGVDLNVNAYSQPEEKSDYPMVLVSILSIIICILV